MTDQEALREVERRWGEKYGNRVFCMRPLGALCSIGVAGVRGEEGFHFLGDTWEEAFEKADNENIRQTGKERI